MPLTQHLSRSSAEALAWSRSLVDPAMRAAVDTLDDPLRHIAGYHLGWWDERGEPADAGGKAIRPAFVLLSARAAGGTPEDAIPAAVGVELMHNSSLLHDDVVDGDETRRHRRTVWHAFGVGQAIMAGDALMTLAADVVSTSPRAADCIHTLARATQELLAGQCDDLDFEHRDDVTMDQCVRMAVRKTAALFGCACELGAIAGGADECQTERMRAFGRQLGLAFQSVDDLLGIWGDAGVTGKPVCSDLASRKKTLPVVAALTSGTAAGDRLAGCYRDGDASLETMAQLVEQAGGRAWTQHQADLLLDMALQDLRRAAVDHDIADELAALAHLIVRRDR